MFNTKLNTLLVLQEEQNFTKASIRLGITQPAVTTHIKQLEQELGCKLLIRNKNDIKPTEQGEIVISYAKRLKALEEKMLNELSSDENMPSKIKIGITHTVENSKIAEVLGKYSSTNGAVTLTIITDVIKNLYTMLENYELDLIIVEEKQYKPKLSYLPLGHDQLLAIVAPENPLAKKNYVTLKELKNEKLIMRLPTSATRELFESTLITVGESINNFNVILEVDNIATIKDLVRKDIGISILPLSSCTSEIKKEKLYALPIQNLSMIRETTIVYPSDFIHKEILDDIVAFFNE